MPDYLADRDLLMTDPYFGQYGTIEHCTLQRHKGENFYGIGLYNVYIMYTTKESATDCIQAIDGVYVDDLYIKASYGTTKYCKYFLSNRECHSSNCLYYHQKAPDSMCFIKEETSGYNPEFYEASHPPKIPNRRNIYFDSKRFPEPKWYLHNNRNNNNYRGNYYNNYNQRSYNNNSSSTPASTPPVSTPKSDIESDYTTASNSKTTKDDNINDNDVNEVEEEESYVLKNATAKATEGIMTMEISSVDHSNFNSSGSEINNNNINNSNNSNDNRQSSSIDTQNSSNTDDVIIDDDVIQQQQQQQQQLYTDPSFISMYQQQHIPTTVVSPSSSSSSSVALPPPGYIQPPQQQQQQQQNISLLQMLMSNQPPSPPQQQQQSAIPKTKYVPPPPGFDETYLEQHNHNNTANKDLLRSLFPNANITYHPYTGGNK